MGLCSLPVVWPEVAQSWCFVVPMELFYIFYVRPNDDPFQEDLFQLAATSRNAAASAPDPVAGCCWPKPPPETPRHSQASLAQSLIGSLLLPPGPWCLQDFVCVLQVSVSSHLWNFLNQISLTFKARFPSDSQALFWISRLGSLLGGLEPSQQC